MKKLIVFLTLSSLFLPIRLFAQEEFVYEGGLHALYGLIVSNMKFPPDARRNGVEGQVILKFKILTDHTIDSLSILNSVSEDIDKEAMRVIKLGDGNWAIKEAAFYLFPVSFRISAPGRVSDESIRKSIVKHLNKKDYSKAIKFLNERRRRNPLDSENLNQLRFAYTELAETENAERINKMIEEISFYKSNERLIGRIPK